MGREPIVAGLATTEQVDFSSAAVTVIVALPFLSQVTRQVEEPLLLATISSRTTSEGDADQLISGAP